MQTAQRRIALFSIHSDPLAPLGSQESGGQNSYVYFLSKFLSHHGYDVDVYTRWDSPKKKQIVYIDDHARVIRLKGGPIAQLKKYDLMNVLPELFQGFLDFTKQEGTPAYELFHGHYWDGGWVAMQAAAHFKKPFIQNFHSIGLQRMQTFQRYETNQKAKDDFERRLKIEHDIIAASTLIISLAETEKRDLMEFYKAPADKLSVIPGGVDFRRFYNIHRTEARERLKLPEEEFLILYTGRLEWRKGIATLIHAVTLLKQEGIEATALIVGGKIHGPEKNEADVAEYERLKQRAIEEGVESRIVFEGRVDQTQLHVYYSAADIQVIPSYYEPFGLVALEGMACKVPIIASRKGGLRITIRDGETGLLFEPRNAYDLKEKIKMYYQHPDLRAKLAQQAYALVENEYSWNKTTAAIIKLYEQCLE